MGDPVQEYFGELDMEIADLRGRIAELQAKQASNISQHSEADVNE